MRLQSTHREIHETIENILCRGGQKLYGSYLKKKIPNHTTENISNFLSTTLETPLSNITRRDNVVKDLEPPGTLRETMTTNRINSQTKSKNRCGKNFSEMKLSLNSRQKSGEKKTRILSARDRKTLAQRQKFISIQPIINPQPENEQKAFLHIRKQKIKSLRKQMKQRELQNKKEEQIAKRLQKLKDQFKQLAVKGIPLIYNDQGTIQILSKNDLFTLQTEKHRNDIRRRAFQLNFKTLEIYSQDNSADKQRQLEDRRRTAYTARSKQERKLKMTNQEYNNQNNRQYSSIPFIDVAEGTRLIEEKNIIAERKHNHSQNRSEFKERTSGNFFRSFALEFQSTEMKTICVNRPYTSAQTKRLKNMTDTGLTSKLQSSILWKPKISSRKCRININNEDLVQTILVVDS